MNKTYVHRIVWVSSAMSLMLHGHLLIWLVFQTLGQGWILKKKNPVRIHRNLIKITLSLGVGEDGPHSQPPFKMAIWDLFSVHAPHLLFCERILKCFQEKDAEIWDISTEEKNILQYM